MCVWVTKGTVRESDEVARVEDEVKTTRQKSAGDIYVDAKMFTGPLPPKGPKGTQGWRKGPINGMFEDIPFV